MNTEKHIIHADGVHRESLWSSNKDERQQKKEEEKLFFAFVAFVALRERSWKYDKDGQG